LSRGGTMAVVRRALLITGVIGVGKSTVADAVGGALTGAGHVTAVVDTDALAQFGPSPGAGFHDRLKCANLAAIWENFKTAGARYAVVSAGIDSAALRRRSAGSLAGCEIRTVRLVAPATTVRDRLLRRDRGDRHLRTLAAQQARLDAAAVEDFTVVNDRPVAVVAHEVIALAWPGEIRL